MKELAKKGNYCLYDNNGRLEIYRHDRLICYEHKDRVCFKMKLDEMNALGADCGELIKFMKTMMRKEEK